MRTLAVLPSRYQASRFPGKPLAPIAGRPMIQWVYEAARRAEGVDRVVVATDDERIAAAVRGFGGEAVLTIPPCPPEPTAPPPPWRPWASPSTVC